MRLFGSLAVIPRWTLSSYKVAAKSLIHREKTSYKSVTCVRCYENPSLQPIDIKPVFMVFFLLQISRMHNVLFNWSLV